MKKRTLALGITPRSIQYIYNLFNFNSIREQADSYKVEEEDYIVHVGRLNLEKDTLLVLKAYVKSGIKQKLLFLGDGGCKNYIKREAENLGIQDKVVLKGSIANPYPYIKNAKALVLGSRMEGLPTVLIEALILGTPVISTDCPTGPKEILTAELAEFLSPVGDEETFANNLRKIIAKPPRIMDKHFAKFDKSVNVQKYLDIIQGQYQPPINQ